MACEGRWEGGSRRRVSMAMQLRGNLQSLVNPVISETAEISGKNDSEGDFCFKTNVEI